MTKILVAEDAAFMRRMVIDILKSAGHEAVFSVDNGERAVEIYKQINPDLVFMDIMMPELDGLNALTQIKSFDPQAKVIMCSAMGQRNSVKEAILLGANDFIVKPFIRERLLQAINNLV